MNQKATARRIRVIREFPFLLDLMVLSMRAGLNYSAALSEAVDNMPPGPVKEDFAGMLREIRAGKSRVQALKDLSARLNEETITNFVAAVNQAEETGSELVSVLTTQAEQRRLERFQAAEVHAGKSPVKMMVAMFFFLFPVIFMLLGFFILVSLGYDGVLPPELWELLN